jgi:hypothetical protein
MTKLLTGVSAIALAAMLIAPAMAADPPDVTADATATNRGTVENNYAESWYSAARTRIEDGTADGAEGIIQMNQNAGANSLLQNTTALAYIEAAIAGDRSLASASNNGLVNDNDSRRYWSNNTADIWGSFNGAQGVINVNQNSGDNSLLQNATAIAALIDCSKCEATLPTTPDTIATARAGNDGRVIGSGNYAYSLVSRADVSMRDSFGRAQGVIQVNQNAGANSLLQNASAVAYVEGRMGDDAGNNDAAHASAYAANGGLVEDNDSYRYGSHSGVAMLSSFNGAQGVINVNQNAGDNSLLQNATAIAALVDCLCTTRVRGSSETFVALADARNDGLVRDNVAYSTYHAGYSSSNASMGSSFNGAQGVMQVNQNAGANSLLQNASAVASIEGKLDDGFAGTTAQVSARATNVGSVIRNRSDRLYTNSSATIRDSFGRASGAANVNQNTGDNSLLQNSTAIAAIRYCGADCLSANLSAVAVATNVGTVGSNRAYANNSSASANIAGSFQGYRGVANVNQNVGANSLLQNSVAIGTITPSTR